jgi:hypothetical protein
MTEADKLRLLELAIQAGADAYQAVDCARQYERSVPDGQRIRSCSDSEHYRDRLGLSGTSPPVETIGDAYAASWRVMVRSAWGGATA